MDDSKGKMGYSRRLFHWWADRPFLHIFVLVMLTSLALVGYLKPSLVRDLFVGRERGQAPSQSLPQLLPRAGSNSAQPPNVRAFRVARGECIVVATCEDFFTPANLTAVREVVAELKSLPQVADVLWIDSIPGLNPFGLPESLLPRADASTRQRKAARQRVLDNPFAVGQLISADGRTMLFHLQIDWFHATENEASTSDLRRAAQAAAARVEGAQMDFKVTGIAPLYLMIAHNHLRDSWKYQLVGYSIMMIAALLLFRGFSAVTIVALAPAMGVFWTMGMLRFLDLQDNPFNDIIVPVLISLVGLTDAVHLMVEIRTQRAAGLETPDATRKGVARVGLACALTSLTTAIGFGSLAWAHHEVVRDFGMCCVMGVGLTFISVLTVVPLGCRSPLGWRLHVGLGKSLVDGQLQRIGPLVAWILRNNRKVSWFAIAATVALAAICTQLEPDEKRYSGLSESGEAAQGLRHLDRALGGLEFGFIAITGDADSSDGELLEVLLEIDQALNREPLLGQSLGLHQLLKALPGEGPANERMTMLELLPPELKRAFYIPEYRQATVQFRVQDIGIAKYGPVFERLEAKFAEVNKRHPKFTMELHGDAVWRWRNVYQILTDLATSLGTASVVIWLILTCVYRSIRIGLISIVPNLFPLVATGAMLCLTGQHLELVTVCVFTICIGIAVDDTIHFLTRYAEEAAAADDHQDAIQRAFTGVGTALLMTTIVLVTGMMTAVFGDARDARLFGIMGAITLTSALFADIFLLPALLSRYAKPQAK